MNKCMSNILEICVTQNNGDVFAFTQNVNNIFKHGVPKSPKNSGPRIWYNHFCWGKLIHNVLILTIKTEIKMVIVSIIIWARKDNLHLVWSL